MIDNSRNETWSPEMSTSVFRAVQERGVFDDAKTFADAVPDDDPARIEERFEERNGAPDFDLREFVETHFRVPDPVAIDGDVPTDGELEQYVDQFWRPLTRSFDAGVARSRDASDTPTDSIGGGTCLPLPNPHVVPGGRFREIYYWDSYFVAEGLAVSGRLETVADMAENFASIVDRFGFVPTGNRTYYTSRSQPPLFYRILRALERERGWSAVEPYVPRLEREYEFWMAESDRLRTEGADERPEKDGKANDAHRRVVRTAEGAILNRYWDDRAAPRPEAYRHDRELAESVSGDGETLYRNVRAACESGWDFSSRWLRTPDDLSTIRTTELLPVDLNALLYGMESALAEWLDAAGAPERARTYEAAADARREAVERLCWHPDEEFYADYCWTEEAVSERLTLAGVVPLFTGLATEARAASVAERLRELFLVDGGLQTTLHESGEQWDRPNGWAPLHWMAVVGLRRYGHRDLAEEVTERWLHVNRSLFDRTGRMAEKYDVCDLDHARGHGEYALQYGFGWTNAVVVALQWLRSEGVDAVV